MYPATACLLETVPTFLCFLCLYVRPVLLFIIINIIILSTCSLFCHYQTPATYLQIFPDISIKTYYDFVINAIFYSITQW